MKIYTVLFLLLFIAPVAHANQTITFDAATGDSTAIGYNAGNNGQKSARSFVPSASYTTFTPSLTLWKSGSPTDNVLIEIQTDNAGSPSGTILGTVTVAYTSLGTTQPSLTSYGTASASLTSGVTYWIVVERSGALSATNYYALGINTGAHGMTRYGADTSAWLALAGYDIYGNVVLSGSAAPIIPILSFFNWDMW